MSSLSNHLYKFGDFALDVDQRVLFRGGELVLLTPKVFDTLLILVESRWPHRREGRVEAAVVA